MSKLTRTACGVFNMQNGIALDELKNTDTPEQYLIPADTTVSFEKLHLTPKQAQKILDGVYENYGFKDGTYRVYNQQAFIGVGRVSEGVLRINSYVR
jgi:tRNA U55 pseudouridine synthase TruB